MRYKATHKKQFAGSPYWRYIRHQRGQSSLQIAPQAPGTSHNNPDGFEGLAWFAWGYQQVGEATGERAKWSWFP